jgi:hypothetical protein
MYRPVGSEACAAATLSWSSTCTAVSLTGGSAVGCCAWPGADGPTRVTTTAATTAAAATLVVVMLRMQQHRRHGDDLDDHGGTQQADRHGGRQRAQHGRQRRSSCICHSVCVLQAR